MKLTHKIQCKFGLAIGDPGKTCVCDFGLKEQCMSCGIREATTSWIGEGSLMDYTHGNYERWCDFCCLNYQVKYIPKKIKEMKENLVKAKRELKEIKKL